LRITESPLYFERSSRSDSIAAAAPVAATASSEGNHIIGVLEDCGWSPRNAAERLGLPPSTLRFRMKKLGIERPSASQRT
jgi:transcriptional regulator with GAF, ATPase, and Fis domain